MLFSRIAGRALAAFLLYAALAAAVGIADAQVAAPAPELTPDAAQLLTWLGLGKYAAGVASIIALLGYVIVHVMAFVPAPASTTGAWPAAYAVLRLVAGNYNKALNQSAAAVKATAVVLLLLGTGAALSACTPAQQTQASVVLGKVQMTAAQAQAYAQDAIKLWGIAKGIAQVAEVADPKLAAIVDPVIAFTDPKVAQAQAALTAADADVPVLLALAGSIKDQANAVTLACAPSITATPNKAP